jgi:chromosome segregation ATPase
LALLDKLEELEKRVTALEISRAETNSELRSINGKLDQLIRTTENIVENFVSTPTCMARQQNMKEDLNGMGSKLRKATEDFNAHIKDHWTKADRMATWLSTALIGAFIIGKLAKVW